MGDRFRTRRSQIVARVVQNQDRNRSASWNVHAAGSSTWIARERFDANTKTKTSTSSRFTDLVTNGTGTRLTAMAKKIRARSAEGRIAAMITETRSAPASRPMGYRTRCQSTIAPAQPTIARSSSKSTTFFRPGLASGSSRSPATISGIRASVAPKRRAPPSPGVGAAPPARAGKGHEPEQAARQDDEPAHRPVQTPEHPPAIDLPREGADHEGAAEGARAAEGRHLGQHAEPQGLPHGVPRGEGDQRGGQPRRGVAAKRRKRLQRGARRLGGLPVPWHGSFTVHGQARVAREAEQVRKAPTPVSVHGQDARWHGDQRLCPNRGMVPRLT